MTSIAMVQMAGSPCVRMRKVVRSLSHYELTYVGCDRGGEHQIDISGIVVRRLKPKIGSKSLSKAFLFPLWALNAARHLRATHYDTIYAADLEAGVAALMSGKRYIYDVLDTYADRYRVPAFMRALIRRVETIVFSKAALRIHVADHRVATLPAAEHILLSALVVPNTPLAADIPEPAVTREYDIIATGNIDAKRGCVALLEEAEALGLSICAVGKISREIRERFSSSKNVRLLPYQPSSEALRLCGQARAIFCAYDPGVEINRLAAPNKVYDAIFCGTPIVINEEVAIADHVVESGLGVSFAWGDRRSLRTVLGMIGDEAWTQKMARVSEYSRIAPTWDLAFQPVVEWIEAEVAR